MLSLLLSLSSEEELDESLLSDDESLEELSESLLSLSLESLTLRAQGEKERVASGASSCICYGWVREIQRGVRGGRGDLPLRKLLGV